VVTVSDDQTARLWDLRTGKTVLLIHPNLGGPLLAAAFSPDGEHLAIASKDIVLYRLPKTEVRRSLVGHDYFVSSLVFHPNKPLLASASGDNSIRLWNMLSGETEKKFPGHPRGQPWGLAFSPDGDLIAAGHDGYLNYQPSDHDVRVWEISTGKRRSGFAGHQTSTKVVAFNASGRFLASGDIAGLVLVHDTFSGAEQRRWARQDEEVVGLQFISPELLAIAHESGWVGVGDCSTGQIVAQKRNTETLRSLATSSVRKYLAIGKKTGGIEVFHLPDLSVVWSKPKAHGEDCVVALSPDGALLASGGQDRRVTLWDTLHGTEILQLPPQEGPINALAFESDGARLAIGGVEEQVTVWDLSVVRQKLTELGIQGESTL
jgi:WD40 repeat protein